mgnify:FL=1
MKRTILFIVAGVFAFASQAQMKLASGSIKSYANFKSNFVDARNVEVWLPENYTPSKKYAVLYMHDGQMLFDSTNTWNHQEWGVDECFTQHAKNLPNTIVVGVWNSGKHRHVDYFPQKPYESLSQQEQERIASYVRNQAALFADGIRSDKYLQFLVYELKPFIDSVFATYKDASHTAIAGSSMGGLISMYAICEYPQIFGSAACLSTHWPGIFTIENNPIPNAFAQYLKTHLPNPASHKLYFDYGTKTLDSLYEPYQKVIDKVMQVGGYTHKNWMTIKYENDDHSEQAWRKRLSVPLKFILN